MNERENDWLEELLEAEPPLPDAGFTQRVLTALPAPPAKTWQRNLIILSCTLFACVLSFFLLPTGEYLLEMLDRSLTLLTLEIGNRFYISVGSLVIAGLILWSVFFIKDTTLPVDSIPKIPEA